MTLSKLVYWFNDRSAVKWVDPDTCGYVDILSDIYSTVLDTIPDGRSINFDVKYSIPDEQNELIVQSDKHVLELFSIASTKCVESIHLSVFNLIVAEEHSNSPTINDLPVSIIGRTCQVGCDENFPENFSDVATVVTDIVRPRKAAVRRGSAVSGSVDMGRGSIRPLVLGSEGTGRGIGNLTTMLGSGRGFEDTIPQHGRTPVNTRSTRRGASAVGSGRGGVIFKSCSTSGATCRDKGATAGSDRSEARTNAKSLVIIRGVDMIGDTNTKTLMDISASDHSSSGGEGSDAGRAGPSAPDNGGDEDDQVGQFDVSSDEEWNDEGEDRSDVNSDGGCETEAEEDGCGGDRSEGDELSDYDSDECYRDFSCEEYLGADGKVEFKVGQTFSDVYHFRAILQDYAIEHGIEDHKVKNEKDRVTVDCKSEGCPWRLHASPIDDGVTFMVKTYNPVHKCTRVSKNSNVTSTWISRKLSSELRADPDMKIQTMAAALKDKYGVVANKMQLYRARKRAKMESESDFRKSYAQLVEYGLLVKEKNPGTWYKLAYEPRADMNLNPQFKRLFICYEACRVGFLAGCRPFIGLDGCFLKGRFGGILLSAIALDGNNGLFPLAFAVVESECKDSWLFFLEQLAAAFYDEYMAESLTFMSDGQKGLNEALSISFPFAHHRYCSRHLYNNFKVKFPGLYLRTMFWAASKAANVFLFEKAMDAIKRHKMEAYNWLNRLPKDRWARHAFDHRNKSDHITNNMSESFNQWVSNLRDKPILHMIDEIRVRLMTRLHARYQKGCTYKGKITPRIKKKLDLVQQDSRFCNPLCAGMNEYEVKDGHTRFMVSLNSWTCECKVWEASGIPCKHAAAAIVHARGGLEDYCSPYFTVDKYLQAHGEMIHPLPDIRNLGVGIEGNVVQPPVLKRQPGRPHKNRRRAPDEAGPSTLRKKSATVTCDICKEQGHNKRTCQKAPVQAKKRGVTKTPAQRTRVQPSQSSSSQVQTRSQSSRVTTNTSGASRKRARHS